jgi:hypothetical protein
MADRPIIFSAPMVRALLAGRKTQTRRIMKVKLLEGVNPSFSQLHAHHEGDSWRIHGSQEASQRFKVPYAAGDRLWVRENHYRTDDGDSEYAVCAVDADEVREHLAAIDSLPAWFDPDLRAAHKRLRPSIHMPRWASRLTLPVVGVRVQCLLDITEEDAEAEGVCHFVEQGHRAGSFEGLSGAERSALVRSVYGSSREAFRALWEGLHGQASWNANPWVVAVSVEVHRANIDAFVAGGAA